MYIQFSEFYINKHLPSMLMKINKYGLQHSYNDSENWQMTANINTRIKIIIFIISTIV